MAVGNLFAFHFGFSFFCPGLKETTPPLSYGVSYFVSLPIVFCVIGSRCKGHTAQRLRKTGLTQRKEPFARCYFSARVLYPIRDCDQPVWIGARVPIATDGRCDSPNRHCAIVVHLPGNVAKSISGRSPGKVRARIITRGVTVYLVGFAEIEP